MKCVQSYLSGTGSYLPTNVVTNTDLEQRIDTSDEWIVARTGIHQRHIASENETTTDLAEKAALRAIADASLSVGDIDLIIVATTTPTHTFPSVATDLQCRLGVPVCPAFDIQAVCAGFVYALDVADKYVKTGVARNALVVGAECMSKLLNWEDRNTCVLFGDGAGAVVVSAVDTNDKDNTQEGIIASRLFADGQYKELLWVPNGISWQKTDNYADSCMQMQGAEVFKKAVAQLRNLVAQVLEGTDYQPSDIDKLIPHQANIRIIKSVAEKLKLPLERVVLTVGEHANTSAASIPLALDSAVKSGQVKRGDLIFMEAFGGGFTWGGQLIRF